MAIAQLVERLHGMQEARGSIGLVASQFNLNNGFTGFLIALTGGSTSSFLEGN